MEVIRLIRRFKIELGYSVPESEEAGTGSKIRKYDNLEIIQEKLIKNKNKAIRFAETNTKRNSKGETIWGED